MAAKVPAVSGLWLIDLPEPTNRTEAELERIG
jgi:hypothetical protein